MATAGGAASLSPAELEVLADAAAGLSVGETAAKHRKSIETVKTQRKSIMLKMSARNIAHAVGIAVQDGTLVDVYAA